MPNKIARKLLAALIAVCCAAGFASAVFSQVTDQAPSQQEQSQVLDELGNILSEQESANQDPPPSTGDEQPAALPSDREAAPAQTDPSQVKGPRGYLKIPSPRPDGWIIDLTGKVTPDEIGKINALCTEIFERAGPETAIVLIPSTGGQDLRQYATHLFNDWGVGNTFRNNGMLIFVSLDERGAEVILGAGIDDDAKVLQARKLMDTIMVPRFKNGEVGSAVYAGARACATQVYSVANLKSPKEMTTSETYKSTGKKINWLVDFGPVPWILGGTVLGAIGLVGGRHWWRYRPRICENCRKQRVMLSEDEDDQFLDPPEIIEERIGSVDYDVWACLDCETVLKLRYGKFFTRYSDCPQCRYKTRLRIERTILAPTTVSGGQVRVIEECENCTYHKNYTYYTPKLPKVKSGSFRSGSGGFSSGGGGGRSSGFGGGRSAGRGASGRW